MNYFNGEIAFVSNDKCKWVPRQLVHCVDPDVILDTEGDFWLFFKKIENILQFRPGIGRIPCPPNTLVRLLYTDGRTSVPEGVIAGTVKSWEDIKGWIDV